MVIAALFIGGLAVFGNYIVPAPKITSPKENSTAPSSKLQRVEDIPQKNSEPTNATNELAKKIAEELLKQNPEGPAVLEDKSWLSVLTPEELVKNLDFDPQDFRPVIKKEKIRIAALDDKTATQTYLKNFQEILGKHWVNLDGVDFDILIAKLEATLADFYLLETPPSLTAIHQKEIELLTLEAALFEKLKNYEADPLEAILAANAYPGLAEEFEKLKADINTQWLRNTN